MKSFLTRCASAVVIVILLLIMNIFGGPVMEAIILAISLIGLNEFYKAIGVHDEGKKFNAFEIVGIIGTICYSLVSLFVIKEDIYPLMLVLVCVFVCIMGVYVFSFPKYEGKSAIKAFFGFMYVPVMLQFMYLTRSLEHGEYTVWLIFVGSWVCDTCAYCVGMLIGKHKMAPILSPKKSIEGAVGGIIGSMIVAWLFSIVFMNQHIVEQNITGAFILIGFVGAIVAQIGDLAASAFKRNYGIKDYGNLIPGHGGIMDRFDSVIFTAPMIYFLARIFINLH